MAIVVANLTREQIVGRERRERVSHQAWCGEGWMNSRRPFNSDVRRQIGI
jgi:hypothetical protein